MMIVPAMSRRPKSDRSHARGKVVRSGVVLRTLRSERTLVRAYVVRPEIFEYSIRAERAQLSERVTRECAVQCYLTA
jgi:hypothetical protein